jgi:alkylation response protein AidB-like acyl-CoA dehydrogenase
MTDEELFARIGELVDEEHQLERSAAPGRPLGEDEAQRLADLEVALDQCWDLLRQRRARRNAGQDPDAAHVRPADVVEGYQQ